MAGTLIMLPALLSDAALYDHQRRHLADQVTVMIPDLSAHDSLEAMAAAVLAAAPEHFSLAGLSMGGYVAFEILRQAPERVDRLALMATNARPDSPEATEKRRGLIDLAQRGRFHGVTPRLIPTFVAPDNEENPGVTEPLYAMAERIGSEGFIREQRAIMGRPDSRPGLSGITSPTLVVGGADDQLVGPDMLTEMAEGIPNARLVMVPQCGHMITLEQPQAATALLQYWLQLP